MEQYYGNVHSTKPETIDLCSAMGTSLNITWTFWKEVSNYLLDLHEKNYELAIFDFDEVNSENTNWVKLLRKQRPKIPVIVFCESIAPEFATQLYSEKVFYLCSHPLDRETIVSIIKAALKV